MLGKMNDLGSHIVNGLMLNGTLSTETIVIFVNSHNKKALRFLKEDKPTEDMDIMPGMDLEDTETRASKLLKTYKVQEGAAQGKSICKQ
jgi:hypothetical protein